MHLELPKKSSKGGSTILNSNKISTGTKNQNKKPSQREKENSSQSLTRSHIRQESIGSQDTTLRNDNSQMCSKKIQTADSFEPKIIQEEPASCDAEFTEDHYAQVDPIYHTKYIPNQTLITNIMLQQNFVEDGQILQEQNQNQPENLDQKLSYLHLSNVVYKNRNINRMTSMVSTKVNSCNQSQFNDLLSNGQELYHDQDGNISQNTLVSHKPNSSAQIKKDNQNDIDQQNSQGTFLAPNKKILNKAYVFAPNAARGRYSNFSHGTTNERVTVLSKSPDKKLSISSKPQSQQPDALFSKSLSQKLVISSKLEPKQQDPLEDDEYIIEENTVDIPSVDRPQIENAENSNPDEQENSRFNSPGPFPLNPNLEIENQQNTQLRNGPANIFDVNVNINNEGNESEEEKENTNDSQNSQNPDSTTDTETQSHTTSQRLQVDLQLVYYEEELIYNIRQDFSYICDLMSNQNIDEDELSNGLQQMLCICQSWWHCEKQMFQLHELFSGDAVIHHQQIAQNIRTSQLLIVMVIGLFQKVVLKNQITQDIRTHVVIFQRILSIFELAYKSTILLVQSVLERLGPEFVQTMEITVHLQQRVIEFQNQQIERPIEIQLQRRLSYDQITSSNHQSQELSTMHGENLDLNQNLQQNNEQIIALLNEACQETQMKYPDSENLFKMFNQIFRRSHQISLMQAQNNVIDMLSQAQNQRMERIPEENEYSSSPQESFTVNNSVSMDQRDQLRDNNMTTIIEEQASQQIQEDLPRFLEPQIQSPFLPEIARDKRYTLVLDLDETLVHYHEFLSVLQDQYEILDPLSEPNQTHQVIQMVNVRPFTREFLQEISQYFELVIFTAAEQEHADQILSRLAGAEFISHRLYRRHTVKHEFQRQDGTLCAGFIKDLSYLGRDLTKTLLVDNLIDNFYSQPGNGIEIKEFKNDFSDRELPKICNALKDIVIQGVTNVQDCDQVQSLRAQLLPNISYE